jgi:hypothetical protein
LHLGTLSVPRWVLHVLPRRGRNRKDISPGPVPTESGPPGPDFEGFRAKSEEQISESENANGPLRSNCNNNGSFDCPRSRCDGAEPTLAASTPHRGEPPTAFAANHNSAESVECKDKSGCNQPSCASTGQSLRGISSDWFESKPPARTCLKPKHTSV